MINHSIKKNWYNKFLYLCSFRDPNDLFAYGDVDGKGIDAKLQHPLGVAFIPSTKSLIVADSYNHKLKTIQDLDQRAASCKTIEDITTNEPGGIGLSHDASILYIADTNNHILISLVYIRHGQHSAKHEIVLTTTMMLHITTPT